MSERELEPSTATCPLDGTVLTLPVTERREDDLCVYVVVTDAGSVSRHIRDEHPERWQQMCEAQRRMNANPFIGGMPRRVDGCFLGPGEDVGNLPG